MIETLDTRLAKVEAELASRRLPIERRVDQLEEKVASAAPKKKDGWDRLQSVSGILTTLVTGGLGLYLTMVVNGALEERKLEASAVKEMRDSITKLNGVNTPEDAQALGLTLGAFGSFAVPALVAALSTPGTARASGARTGLLAASLTDKPFVCAALVEVVTNRSRRYTVSMHIDATELMGQIGCRDRASAAALKQQLARVSQAETPAGFAAFERSIDSRSPLKREDIAALRERLCATEVLRDDPACAAPAAK